MNIVDPTKKLTFFGRIKDMIYSFAQGESEDERKTRLALSQYSVRIAEEQIKVETALSTQSLHLVDLISEFKELESQLCSWGLVSLLPLFRTQAMMRLSRVL